MMRTPAWLSGLDRLAFIAAIFLATSGAQAAVPIVVGGELLGATGVNVGGTVYDVEIVEGTCVGLYRGCDDLSDFAFTTLADAEREANPVLLEPGGARPHRRDQATESSECDCNFLLGDARGTGWSEALYFFGWSSSGESDDLLERGVRI